MEDDTTAIEAATFRRLLAHLDAHKDLSLIHISEPTRPY